MIMNMLFDLGAVAPSERNFDDADQPSLAMASPRRGRSGEYITLDTPPVIQITAIAR